MPSRSRRPTKSRLRELIEEATLDAYGDAEQRTGFATMVDEHLATPFEVSLLGTSAQVIAVGENDAGELVALCRRGRASLRVSLLDLPCPKRPPEGWEWVEAYREWARGSR